MICHFDTETTGKDSATAELIELCMMKGSLPELGKYSSLFKPDKPIPPEASAVNHITNKMVLDSPKPKEREERIRAFLEDVTYICAHNIPYDMDIMNRCFPWFGEKFPAERRLDTLRWARHLYPQFPSHGMQYLRYALNLPEIPSSMAHRADADVIVLRTLFYRMVEDQFEIWDAFDDPPASEEEKFDRIIAYAAMPIEVKIFSFGKYRGKLVEDIACNDLGYIRWLLRQAWLPQEHPDLFHTLKNQF